MKAGPKFWGSRAWTRLAVGILALWTAAWGQAQPAPAPAPSPRGTFQPVDLSKFCTTSFANLPVGDVWESVPTGKQVLDGMLFQIDGRLEVTGMTAAREGDFAPTRLEGIPVGRKASRLVLLHGAIGSEDDGVPLAKLVLHYADGRTRDLRIAYGAHVRNCLGNRKETRTDLADRDSRVVWAFRNDNVRSDFQLRLFQTAWANPRPDEVIQSFDVVSFFSRATPVLVALTLAEDPVGPEPAADLRRTERKAHDWSDAAYRRQFVVQAFEASNGAPLTNALAYLTLQDDKSSFYFGAGQADASGRIALDYPPQQTVGCSLLVRAPNRMPVILTQSRTNRPGDFADEFQVKLQPGARIGGVVKTSEGKPVADAEILVAKVIRESSRRYLQIDYDTALTDAAGRWSSTAVPPEFEEFQFEVTHPLFRPVRYLQAGGTNASAGAVVPGLTRPAPPATIPVAPTESRVLREVLWEDPLRTFVDTALIPAAAVPAMRTGGLVRAAPLTNRPPADYPALINVDFGDGTNSSKVGRAATGRTTNDFWNLYSRDERPGKWRTSGTVTNLLYADRAWSGVSLTVSNAPGAWGNGAADPMYNGYLYPLDSGRITVKVENLPPGLYDLYVYGHEASSNRTCAYDLVVGTGSHGSKTNGVGPGWNSTNWQEGVQYVVFRDVQVFGPEDALSVVARPPHRSTLAVIAGLQVHFLSNDPGPRKTLPPIQELVQTETTELLTVERVEGEVRSETVTRRTVARPPRSATAPPPLSKQALLAGNAEMVLEPVLRVMGVVADAQGKPVPQAQVFFFDNPESRESRGSYKADDQGRFTFMVAEPTVGALAVLAKGYMPKYWVTALEGDASPLTIALRRGEPAKGRVRSPDGQPVTNAMVRVESWHNNPLLRWQTRTDSEGRFTWENAPEDPVRMYFTASNYNSTTYSTTLNRSSESLFTLSRPFVAIGRVVDAETKKPIDEFVVVQGYRYNQSFEAIRWLRYNVNRGRGGEFTLRLNDYGSATNWVLIEAKGYLPVLSAPFARGGAIQNYYEMKRGRGLQGVVQRAGGEPVPNCTVVLSEPGESPSMDRDAQLRYGSSRGDSVRTDSQGRFEFAPKLDARRLFAAHDAGYAEASPDEVRKTGKVTLVPWGRVTGSFRIGQNGWAGQPIVVQSAYNRYGGEEATPRLSLWLRATTDANGDFVIERVPPGDRRVSWEIRLREGNESVTAHSHGLPILLKPGDTASVTLGGPGRAVIGRIATMGADPASLDWRRDAHSLNLRVPFTMDIPGPDMSNAKTDEERQRAWADHRQRQREFWDSEQGKAIDRQFRTYTLQFQTNGAFRLDSVPPGTYDLSIYLNEREEYPGGGWSSRQIGSLSKEVIVPPASPGRPDEPLDLGAIQMAVRRTLRLGDLAPSFETKTLDGKTIKLENFRGTNVLLYFHATWAGGNRFDTDAIKSLLGTYGTNGTLVVLGLSVDHTQKDLEDFAKTNQVKWTQCYLGRWADTQVPALFGVEGVPNALFIDAEGKVRYRNLRGSSIRTMVQSALGSRTRAAVRLQE